MTDDLNLTNSEILALIKLIFYVKFESNESDSLLFAGSDLINTALQKFLDCHPYYQSKRQDLFQEFPKNYLTNLLSKIESEKQEYKKLDNEKKSLLIANYCFPFKPYDF